MTLIMDISQITTIDKLKQFLVVNQIFTLSANGKSKREIYDFLRWFLIQIKYFSLRKKEKWLVLQFIKQITSYSDVHLKRIIKRYIKWKLFWNERENHNSWEKIYTQADIALLHEVDLAHKLSWMSTSKILKREYEVFWKKEFIRLQNISVSHIYNLRLSHEYLRLWITMDKTKPVVSNIWIRMKPEPNWLPWYLRVDTVHQWDFKSTNWKYNKWIYHINIVDEVTQIEYIFSVPAISEKYMKLVLEYLYTNCFFKIINFHSDNWWEFINKVVAWMLQWLHIGQTKSRSRKTNDNALVETKNWSIVRKHFWYFHIPANEHNAKILNEFSTNYLNVYLNFHRPCWYATIEINSKWKEKKKYKKDDYQTPYEKFKLIPDSEKYLQRNFSFEKLDKIAYSNSDTEFANIMNKEKERLFKQLDLKANQDEP